MAENNTKKYDWLRIISTALLICALIFGLFYLHSGKVADIIESLTEEEKYPNTIWLIEFVSTALPILVIVIAMGISYSDKKSYVPVYTQKEKLLVSVIIAIFTFGVLLGYVLYQSRGGETTDAETGDVIKTLWDRTYMWFFAQILPMLILITYHSMRISAEKRELAEAEEAEKRAEESESDGQEENVAEEEPKSEDGNE